MNTKLAGIVGKPESRYTPDGKAVLTFDELVAWITKLEKRVAKLERANKPAPKKDPSVGVYYRDGKPCKRKPRDA